MYWDVVSPWLYVLILTAAVTCSFLKAFRLEVHHAHTMRHVNATIWHLVDNGTFHQLHPAFLVDASPL